LGSYEYGKKKGPSAKEILGGKSTATEVELAVTP